MSLLDQARNKDGSAVAWRPETKGEGVEGTITEVSHQPSDHDAAIIVPSAVLLQDDGTKVRIIGYRTVLRQEMDAANLEVGDRAAFVYMGAEKIKSGKWKGKDAFIYRVVSQKPSTAASGTDTKTDEVPF